MKLTNEQVQRLGAALAALDGADKLTNDGRAIKEPYRFKHGKTYLSIATNQNIVQDALDTVEAARAALVKSILPDGSVVLTRTENPEGFDRYTQGFQEILDTEVELPELEKINAEDLDLERNAIPSAALAVLMRYGVVTRT